MIAAVQSGYHVYLEKPPAATIQEVDGMIVAVRRTGRLCAVGFQALWSQSMAFLKLRVAEGASGDGPHAGLLGRLGPARGLLRPQRLGRHASGRRGAWVLDGTINNPLAHGIANMLYLATPQRHKLAQPLSVRAELYAGHDIAADDTAAVEIRTAKGPRCYFLATLCPDDQFDPELTIIADKATAYRHYQGRVSIRYADGRIEQPSVDDQKQHAERFENFIAAAEANDASRLQCHLEMCRPFTLAVNGVFESAERVRRINPAYLRHSGQGLSRRSSRASTPPSPRRPASASSSATWSFPGRPRLQRSTWPGTTVSPVSSKPPPTPASPRPAACRLVGNPSALRERVG